MISEINPPAVPAIVRSVEDTKTAEQWHNVALEAEKKRSAGTLEQSEAWYYLKTTEGFRDLGYQSINEYIYKVFSKSGATATKYIRAYEVFVVELGKSMEELVEVGAGKLCRLTAHVTPENVDQVLADAMNMTQQEISDKIKDDGPIEAAENENKTLKFKGPTMMVEAIEDSIGAAKQQVCSMTSYETPDSVPPLMALEHICANYNASVDLDGNPVATLENALKNLESAFGVKISWAEADE